MNKIMAALLLSWLTTPVWAMEAPSKQSDADLLSVALDRMPALKANFSQRVIDNKGKLIQEGRGLLALSQPQLFYWHLTSPDESLIVAKQDTVWVYNPFAEEVSILDMANVLSASPMALLVQRDKSSWDKYRIAKRNNCFDITPKNSSESSVTKVEVCFQNQRLADLALTDAQDSVSHFHLSEQSTLSKEDMALFDFKLPDGVSIDDQRNQGGAAALNN